MFPDGSRLHVVNDSPGCNWSVNITKLVVRATHLEHLVGLGSLTSQAVNFVEAAVSAGLNVLIALNSWAQDRHMVSARGEQHGE